MKLIRPFMLVLFATLIVLSSMGCVMETDYESETGTLTIPWGSKTGNQPQEADPDTALLNP